MIAGISLYGNMYEWSVLATVNHCVMQKSTDHKYPEDGHVGTRRIQLKGTRDLYVLDY